MLNRAWDKVFPIQIETITDGGALLLRLRRMPEIPDFGVRLILLDANLPKRSTAEVLTILAGQNLKVNVPIVVLSSFVTKKSLDRPNDLCATAVLDKPIDLGQLPAVGTESVSDVRPPEATSV